MSFERERERLLKKRKNASAKASEREWKSERKFRRRRRRLLASFFFSFFSALTPQLPRFLCSLSFAHKKRSRPALLSCFSSKSPLSPILQMLSFASSSSLARAGGGARGARAAECRLGGGRGQKGFRKSIQVKPSSLVAATASPPPAKSGELQVLSRPPVGVDKRTVSCFETKKKRVGKK